MKLLEPDIYIDKITNLKVDFLKEQGIKGLLIDIDSTVMGRNYELIDNIKGWIKEMKKNNIKVFFVSNTHNKRKKKIMRQKLNSEVIIRAYKPLSRGFKEAMQKLNLTNKEVAVIGDQLFTDILGGNILGCYTVMVSPLEPEYEAGGMFIIRCLESLVKRIRR
ncbi:MAG: YqeG family HAD IIIA-type phosphatase [Bacilli bacterium]|nr:YqeG family HAD IIIA-type phosphatase [Bacilli bacterium]